MVQAYNFLASWQLFPEKGTYPEGERPVSGTLSFEAENDQPHLCIRQNRVSLSGQAYAGSHRIIPDGRYHPFENEEIADRAKAWFSSGIRFQMEWQKNNETCLELLFEIMPNGYLMVTEKGSPAAGRSYESISYYYKQMSVLPYAASVAGAVIRPTREGVIRHKALTAMEEQTNMQLEQIRRQIELLALQAQEIHQRKELSMLIYEARLNFDPVIGHRYYVYEKNDGTHILSMISPQEWGNGAGPFKRFVAAVKLLADHTWAEMP